MRVLRKGVVSFGKSLSALLEVSAGDKVSIFYDDVAKEWYLAKDAEGWELRDPKKTWACWFLQVLV